MYQRDSNFELLRNVSNDNEYDVTLMENNEKMLRKY